MRSRASAKEVAALLLRFTVAEPAQRRTIMASLDALDEAQRAKIRDEIMFLDIVVIANLMGTGIVKQRWPKSEEVLVEYLAAVRESLELTGANSDGFLRSLETRECVYRDVLTKPLYLARFAVGGTFAEVCDSATDPSIEVAGMGEFVSVVNHVGDLVSRYKVV
jgi:hypothetical protein